MKKKSNDAKLNPSCNDSRANSLIDRQLVRRVEQYLEDNKHKPVISVSVMADDLRSQYRDYTRKKLIPFKASVDRAYSIVCKKLSSQPSDEEKDNLSALETKHLNKKLKTVDQDEIDAILDDDKSFSTDNEQYVEYKDSNAMNSFLADMYSKKVSANISRPAAGSTLATDSANLGFFVDRKGSKPTSITADASSRTSSRCPSPASVHSSSVLPQKDGNTVAGESVIVIDDGASNDLLETAQNSSMKRKISAVETSQSGSAAGLPDFRPSSGGRSRKRPPSQSAGSSMTDRITAIGGKRSKIEVQQSTTRISEFGGSISAILDIIDNVLHMKQSSVQQLGITFPRGILLHGPPGCGKTLLANAIAGEVGCSFIKMSGTQLVSGVSGESEERIRDLFDLAVEQAPCIIFLDEIDSIAPKRETASKDMERRIVAQLLTCMDDLCSKPSAQVVVLGATNRPDSLDTALRRAGRFDQEVAVGIPDETARMMILKVLCEKIRLAADIDIHQLAQLTPGYVGVDLRFLVTKAGQICIKRLLRGAEKKNADTLATATPPAVASTAATPTAITSITITPSATNASVAAVTSENSAASKPSKPMDSLVTDVDETGSTEPEKPKLAGRLQGPPAYDATSRRIEEQAAELATALRWLQEDIQIPEDQLFITFADFQAALKQAQPSSKREGFATVPGVTWEHIGALQSVHRELQKSIIWPIKYPDSYRSRGARHCGILLTGPPGNGKTLVAKAVANELGLNFISVKGPELLSMYVGESEKAVRQVFRRASDSSPCVIFFDELDSLFQQRRNSDVGGNKVNVVNQLLTELDGFDNRKQVYVIGATNRLDMIDPAFLRPGRFDKTLYIGLPNSEGRFDILRALSRSELSPFFSSDVDLALIANHPRCEGMSGADLGRILVEAEHLAMEEIMGDVELSSSPPVAIVCQRHLETILGKITPSVKDQARYEKMRKKFGLG